MNDNIFFTIRLLSIIFFTSQLCIAQHIEQKPGSSFDIKNKANELGITAGQLEQLLKSSQNNGKPGGDPLPEAMQEKFFSGQSAGDNFGYSVSTAGDVNGDGYSDVIVGAYHNDAGGADAGRAYIYFGGNIINSVADLVLTGAAANDFFGNSVSTAGDVNSDGYSDVIVGALRNDAGGIESGRAYIYFGGSSMNNTSDVILTGAAANDFFGYSVSTAGDINGDGYSDVIVGAYLNDAGGTDAGSTYIYFGGSSMNNTSDVILTGAAANDLFGYSVSTAGDVNGDGYSDVIVGAPYNDAGGGSAGRAYIYFGGVSMDNTSDVILTGAAASDFFGISVSTAGDVNGDGYTDVIVGAPYNDAGGSSAGRAYIYFGGSSMNNSSDVILTGAAANDFFGNSVSTAGDVNGDGYTDVIVGAYLNDAGGNAAGRAYIYFGDSSMDNTLDVILTGAEANDRFGNSVSTAGDVNGDGYSDVIVGAFENDAGGADAGRAYLYINSLTGTDIPDEFFTGVAARDLFGYSVSTAGDVNGDGYSDVIVGAYSNDAGGIDAGRAYIYFGGSSMNNTSDVILTGAAVTDFFGVSVSTAGDVNGDGYSDVIVGADGNDAGGSSAGRAYIYFGGSSMDSTSDVILTGSAADDRFGSSVSTAGDVNGDGYSDVIVGAPDGGADAGRAYIYFGSSSMNNTSDVILTGAEADDHLGSSVSTAGDVNGDGYTDVIVGAAYNDAGGADAGRAYIYFGSSSMNNYEDVILTGAAANDFFGYSVSTAGDVNGDGYIDVIVGAPYNDAGGNGAGRTYIYFGGSSMDNTSDLILTGVEAGELFGNSVSTAGDVNGDGYSDVIVGAYLNDAGGYFAGRAYIYFGGVSMDNTSDVILTGEADDLLGSSVSTAGDVNGDGYSDVIVGAYFRPSGGESPGRAYLYLSSAPPIIPRIMSAKDVPFDQGGYLFVNFVRSGYDARGENNIITEYLIEMSNPPGINGFSWIQIGSVQPVQNPLYTFIAETPSDSMTNNSGTYYFRVTARTSDPNQYWRSNIMSGHSADNLAPAAPLNFYANLLTGQVKLGWIANTEEDLKNYIIYRTNDPGANPDTLEVFAEVLDTTFIDTNPLPETAYYYLKSQDVHNNLSNYVSVTVSAQTTFTLSVSVTDGWNMVSVPGLHPTNQNVSTWWPNRNLLADVYRWTTTYVPVTLAAPTQGYWMLHNGSQTYNTGDEWPAGGIQIVARDPIPLTAGWNMIGGYENTPLVSGLTTTPPSLIVPGTVYGWTGTYSNATNLVPGYGYWVLSTGNGVINSPTVADGSAKLLAQDDKSEWGKITITDASGKSYTLYSVDGKVNLDQYQMPPLPPTGMFDVRFGSNRKAENLKENSQTIEMRGLVYPVTVRAEKIGIKIEDETGKMVSERLKSGEEITISNSSINKLMVSGEVIPDKYALEQNYPNPFNPSTKIEFSIPEDVNNVTLTIYNALGQRVTELVNSKLEAGKYSYVWNASDVATGLYIYELRTDKFVSVKKMIMLK